MEDGISRARLEASAPDRFIALRRELGVTAFGLNQIVLEPGQRGRIHRHAHQEEVYLVLDGILDLVVEGETSEVREGELVRVAPDLRRQLVNRGPGRLSLLAIGGAGEHQRRDGEAHHGWDDPDPGPPQDKPLPEDLPSSELRGSD